MHNNQHDGSKLNYALMKYLSSNIGEEIQSIAARRFLPSVNVYVYRECLNSFRPKSEQKFKLILNGWWMHHPKCFPPSEYIDPLLVSMHFDRTIRSVIAGNRSSVNYLREHGPVGCRDKDTMSFLLEHDIPAYYSGCMTLTLTENRHIKASEGGGVCIVC